MKKFLFPVSLIFLVLLLSGWGSKGHKKISQNFAVCLPAKMGFLNPGWTSFVANHGSDADYRKDQDPNESPRHFIDIDNYPEFVINGLINHSYDSVVAEHGLYFVTDQGILPWATLRSYDSLKSCFQRSDWNRASLFAADLGHYVADGQMPLHIAKNYNGQLSGQTGIHSRYETKLIERYETSLVYPVDSAIYIANVSSYIFNYLYANYKFVDSILLADLYATQIAGSVYSDAYYQAFWEKTGKFTINLMRNGSTALASLIYTAWIEAGSPTITPYSIDEPESPGKLLMLPVYPNPACDVVFFPVVIPFPQSFFTLEIYDLSGNLKDTIIRQSTSEEIQNIGFNSDGLSRGTYLCVLKSGSSRTIRKFVVTH
ncbi:MAG: T9SS type A sorting domain-containing protein [Bacteroidota bacterium]